MEIARAPTSEEAALFEMLRAKATEFATYIKTKYPQNPMTQALLKTWSGEVMASKKKTGATFSRKSGCLVINPYFETLKKAGSKHRTRTDTFDPTSRLLTRVLHELAHSWSGPHNAKFYEAQRWFVRVASDELGWKLDVTCRLCCYSDSGCDPQTICPKCTWVESDCTSTTSRRCGAV